MQTPKLVGTATEGGANVFRVDYLGRPAYLAQSPQFYKQIMVGVFERVFEVGPVFRAEPHDTPRHLNEYVSLDAEQGFIESHLTVMETVTRVMRGMLRAVQEQAPDALQRLQVVLPLAPTGTPSGAFPCIDFAAALDLIWRETGEDARGEPDLAPAHERWLGEWARREHGSDFLFVTGQPVAKRPFYTHPEPEHDPGSGRARPSRSFDLLFRGVEIVTGGQRLHRYEDYLAGAGRAGDRPRAVRRVLAGLPARDAPARGVRHRAGALGGAPGRAGQRAGGDPLPAGSQPPQPLTLTWTGLACRRGPPAAVLSARRPPCSCKRLAALSARRPPAGRLAPAPGAAAAPPRPLLRGAPARGQGMGAPTLAGQAGCPRGQDW